MPSTNVTLPVTHRVEVFHDRRVPCLNYPQLFPAKRLKPGVYELSLQDDHYVVLSLTSMQTEPETGSLVEAIYGWLSHDLELWSELPDADERRVTLTKVKELRPGAPC